MEHFQRLVWGLAEVEPRTGRLGLSTFQETLPVEEQTCDETDHYQQIASLEIKPLSGKGANLPIQPQN
jgi:hypothetical protein